MVLDMQAKGELADPKAKTKDGNESLTSFINPITKFNCINLNVQFNEIDPIVGLASQSCA